MSISALSGPLVVFGVGAAAASANGGTTDYNPQLGPSAFLCGSMLLDPRTFFGYDPGRAATAQTRGWSMVSTIPLVDAAPATQAAANIAAAAVPVAGTAMTLVSSTGSGVTVGISIQRADTGATVTGLLALDGAMDTVKYGDDRSVQIWDPTKALCRNIRITSVGNDSTATFTVRGYDLYGQPMSEIITGANAGIATGIKCFKYVASVTPAGTLSGANASVGTGDVFGFPLRVDDFSDAQIFWNSALITASTGFTAAVTTDPATGTTGDVRGKYGVQSASDGSKKLILRVTPKPSALAASMSTSGMTMTGLLGVTQFTN